MTKSTIIYIVGLVMAFALGTTIRSVVAQPAPRWEYKLVNWVCLTMECNQRRVNDHAADGWELVQIVIERSGETYYAFRRPRQ